jgi:mycothiol system anti-sigma-R factor
VVKERCRDILGKAMYALDGEAVSEAELAEIETHFEDCRPCFERHGLDRETKLLIARLRGNDVCPDTLRRRITILIRQS